MSNKCQTMKARLGFTPCGCQSYCPSRRLGCCNSENSSFNCAGPVHLTAQWDIGTRPCCKGAGKKYTALGGLLNYCSVNGGKEFSSGEYKNYVAPYPLSHYSNILIPKNNPPPGQYTDRGSRIPGWGTCKYDRCGNVRENYRGKKISTKGFGIY